MHGVFACMCVCSKRVFACLRFGFKHSHICCLDCTHNYLPFTLGRYNYCMSFLSHIKHSFYLSISLWKDKQGEVVVRHGVCVCVCGIIREMSSVPECSFCQQSIWISLLWWSMEEEAERLLKTTWHHNIFQWGTTNVGFTIHITWRTTCTEVNCNINFLQLFLGGVIWMAFSGHLWALDILPHHYLNPVFSH